MPTFTVSSRPGEPGSVDLDHTVMPYAGKFGRRRTGTAVFTGDDRRLAAIAFSPDRRDPACCRIRYLAVARDEQGRGHGGAMADAFVDWALDHGYESVRITVRNPYALSSLDRVGFGFTGETGPSGGVVLTYPSDTSTEPIEAAFARLSRDGLSDEQRSYVRRHLDEADTVVTDG